MYCKNNIFFIVFKFIFVIICGFGLSMHIIDRQWADFNYYTVLSNAFCFVYFLVSLIVNLQRLYHRQHTFTWRPRLEGAVLFTITVTLLIYNFMLKPPHPTPAINPDFFSPLNIIQHYIVPFAVIFDWLVFVPKRRWRRADPISWVLIPFAYFIYILIRAPFAGDIAGTESPYPYAFIDIQLLGIRRVLLNVLWLAPAMILLAYAYFFLDIALYRLGRWFRQNFHPHRSRQDNSPLHDSQTHSSLPNSNKPA